MINWIVYGAAFFLHLISTTVLGALLIEMLEGHQKFDSVDFNEWFGMIIIAFANLILIGLVWNFSVRKAHSKFTVLFVDGVPIVVGVVLALTGLF